MSWNRRKSNEKCIECSKILWRYTKEQTPSCYIPERCKRKRAYYRKHDYYKAKARESHRYMKHLGECCSLCGKKEKLEVHHIIPQCKGGTDDWTNLITLCPSCHSVITHYYRTVGWESKFNNIPDMVLKHAETPQISTNDLNVEGCTV